MHDYVRAASAKISWDLRTPLRGRATEKTKAKIFAESKSAAAWRKEPKKTRVKKGKRR
jgi:hypothetical protein